MDVVVDRLCQSGIHLFSHLLGAYFGKQLGFFVCLLGYKNPSGQTGETPIYPTSMDLGGYSLRFLSRLASQPLGSDRRTAIRVAASAPLDAFDRPM